MVVIFFQGGAVAQGERQDGHPSEQISGECLNVRILQHDFKIHTLRIQICPEKGISPVILLWGWDWDHQTFSRKGYGSFGIRSWELTYPTGGKGKSSSKVPFWVDMLVPWRVYTPLKTKISSEN